MKESTRNEIVRLDHGGASIRRIARLLRVSRSAVKRVLDAVHLARQEGGGTPELPAPKTKRPSLLDQYEAKIHELLDRYPDITAVRLWEELRALGFEGKYTIVRERLRVLRPASAKLPVIRFETGPGHQAQMDYSPYTLDFLEEGRRRVSAFSYILAYSRRQYVHFVESEDHETTVREHVRAFEHLGGVAAVCLYDNMKVVVSRYDDEEPVYNARFLAFATHYGFRPWACRRRRSQTKGKVERPFDYIEKNLLNARTFRSLAHLNEVTRIWLETVADVRIHRVTKRRPIDLHAEEKPHLLPLPEHSYEIAEVVYRVVRSDGAIAYRQNFYSVPWTMIGELVPVRITERELIVYGRDLRERARHPLFDRATTGRLRHLREHDPAPRVDPLVALRERYAELGEAATRFLEGLVQTRRYARKEARLVLDLLVIYRKADLARALERAVRYRAYSPRAIERILAAEATPRPPQEALDQQDLRFLEPVLEGERVGPRDTAEYQSLLHSPEPDPDDDDAQDRAEEDDGEAEEGEREEEPGDRDEGP